MILIISYRPFWETLKKKGITQYQLIHQHGFSTGTLDALRKGRSITLNTLQDICNLLACPISDVVEFLPDPAEGTIKLGKSKSRAPQNADGNPPDGAIPENDSPLQEGINADADNSSQAGGEPG